jgi:hypothetical protein
MTNNYLLFNKKINKQKKIKIKETKQTKKLLHAVNTSKINNNKQQR